MKRRHCLGLAAADVFNSSERILQVTEAVADLYDRLQA